MACVICGKKQRIIPVHTVKYSTQNTLPEVLSVAIGKKITSENWNEDDKHICYGCNRQCEEYDRLNTRLQDLKEHLLQEYTKRLYREIEGASDMCFKPIRLQAQDCEDGGMISDDGGSEGIPTVKVTTDGDNNEDGASEGGKETANEGEKEAANEGGKETANEGGKETANEGGKETANEGVKETGNEGWKDAEKARKNNQDDKDKVEKEEETNPETLVIKAEELDEEPTLDDPEWCSQNLPESVSDEDAVKSKKQVTRLTEKTNLRRLPDFEYRQWYSLDGYSYILHTQSTRGQLLRCHKRGCGVSARVTLGALVKICGEHTHEPDVRIVERNKLYAKLKDRCMKDATTPLKTIYDQESAKFPGGAACLPFPEVRMREWRAANDSTVVVHTPSGTDAADATTLEDTGKRFQCEVCNMGFNSSRLLIRHADKHNKSKTVGRKKLSGNTAFVASSPMTSEKKRLKKKLDKTLSRVISRLKADESGNDTENDAPVSNRCHKCDSEFATLKQLKAHIVKEHREVLMCVHCDVAFDTPLLLRRHRTSCRRCCNERLLQRDADNTKEREIAQDEEMVRELGRITGQDVTDYVGQDENDPNWEVTNAEESTADEEDNEVRIRKRRSNDTANRPQQCEVCQKTFPTLQQLNTHLYTHSSRKKYECSTCGENFSKKAVLTRHMIAQNHRGRIKINPPEIDSRVWSDTKGIRCVWDGTKYECAVCATSFPRKLLLLQHMKDEEHITDQIIIHDAQPQTMTDTPRKKFKMGNDIETILSAEDGHIYPKTEVPDEPIALGGLRFNSKAEAIRAWYDYSGKLPYECAVCGAGFMSKIRLLAHMEDADHLADSIVENIPVLEDMIVHIADRANQIVPSDMYELPIEIKQESGRVEILSQVIINPEEARERAKTELDSDQTYFIQTENVNGETVMVIQGDLGGSLHENMQLFMDEDGNIVSQDEDGNTVQVMQLDLSAMQEQNSRREAEESEDDGEYAMFDDTPGAGLHVDGSGQQESSRGYCEGNEGVMCENPDNEEATRENGEAIQDNKEEFLDNEQGIKGNEERTHNNGEGTEDNVEGLESGINSEQHNNGDATQGIEKGSYDNVEETQNNEERTHNNEEDCNEEGTEDNVEIIENDIESEQDNNEESAQDNKDGSRDNVEQANEELTRDNEESTCDIKSEPEVTHGTIAGINDDMKGNQDNMEVNQDKTENTEHNVPENIEETQDTAEEIQENIKETNIEYIEDKDASKETKENTEKAQDKSGEDETAEQSTEKNVDEDRTEEKIEESKEPQKGKQNRTEQKDSKAVHTPRMKTRNLEKIEKAEAASSITSRLRRSRNQN